MTRHTILSTIFFTTLSLLVFGSQALVFAATPVPSPKTTNTKAQLEPTPSPTSEDTTTQKIKERIDRVIEERRDQVRGVIDQLGQQKRGFIGEVQRVTEKTVTVKTRKGTSQILTITPEVVLLRDNKKATIDDVAIGDWVLAMGYVNGEEFTLRRVHASSKTLQPRNAETTIGSVQSITRTELSLIPRSTENAGEVKKFTLDKNTRYQDARGGAIKREDIEKDSQYLIISYTQNNVATASVVRSLVEKRDD